MEFKKCLRCGNFYYSNGNVCPKCSTREIYELSTFKSYLEENGLGATIEEMSYATGISTKNLNRFMEYNSNEKNNDNFNFLGNSNL